LWAAACGAAPKTVDVDTSLVVQRRAARYAEPAPGPLPGTTLRNEATLEDLRRQANTHPALVLARHRALAPLAEAEFAGLWPDPTLSINLDRIISGAFQPLEWSAQLGLSIPWSGASAAHESELRAEAELALAHAAEATYTHLALLDERWLAWLEAQLEAEALQAHAAALAPLLTRAELAEDAGALEHTEVDLLRLAASHARSAAEAALRAVGARALDVRLAVGLGSSAEFLLARPPEYARAAPAPPVEDALLLALERHPTTAAARAALLQAEATLRREWRARLGPFQFSPGPGDRGGSRSIVATLGLPLPLWNRNRAGIARATVERDLAAEALALAIEGALDTHERAARELVDAETDRARFEADVLPLAEAQLARLESIAPIGELRLLLLLEAERALRDAGLERQRLALRVWRATLTLERLAPAALATELDPDTDALRRS